MRKFTAVLIVITLFAPLSFAQQIDEQMVARIKTEGFQNSQAMDTLGYLSDVFGPRLTNSPNLKAAQAWTRDKMASWGLKNAAIEPWGTFGSGWSIDRFSAEMLAPTYDRLNVYPLAWSPSIAKTISGSPVLVDIKSPADFEKYRGKLKDAIVFRETPAPETEAIRSRPQFQRLTDDELRKAAQATDPSAASEIGGSTTTLTDEEADWQSGLSKYKAIVKFLHDEGVAALVEASRVPNGVLLTQGFYDTNTANNVPAFVMSREQYGRIVRLIGRNVPVKIELSLQTHSTSETSGSNIVAEIPGSDPAVKDEIVMLGGHFDSWHSGTGATDNGAGCAAAMEALRILSAVGAKPRRTIRVALWDGEEEDYFGSAGYARKHFGDPFTGKLKPDAERLDAYLNLDNGSGKIRGIFLQGNEAARAEFAKLLKPFDYLGADTISILNTGETDHMIFNALGFPSFEFIQDPLDYESRVHHSNLDVMEAVNENDLKINAVVMASVAYGIAMSDQPFPRKPKN